VKTTENVELETACKTSQISDLNDLSEVGFNSRSINMRNTKLASRWSDYRTAPFVRSQALKKNGKMKARTLMYQFGVKNGNDSGHLVQDQP
jgi:hypothetical protein